MIIKLEVEVEIDESTGIGRCEICMIEKQVYDAIINFSYEMSCYIQICESCKIKLGDN